MQLCAAAKCAELLGMETSVPVQLGVVAKCAGPTAERGFLCGMGLSAR